MWRETDISCWWMSVFLPKSAPSYSAAHIGIEPGLAGDTDLRMVGAIAT